MVIMCQQWNQVYIRHLNSCYFLFKNLPSFDISSRSKYRLLIVDMIFIAPCKLWNWFSSFFLSRQLLLQWPAQCHTWNLSCRAHMFHHLKNSSHGLRWHSSFQLSHQIIQTFIDLSIHLSTHYLLKLYSYEIVTKFHHCEEEALQTSSTGAGYISALPSQYLIYNFVLILVILNNNLF